MDPVARQARERPEAPAVVGHGARTWAEWDREITEAAVALARLGVERIALRHADRLRLATLALGAVRAGCTGVLVPTRWPGPFAAEALAGAGVRHAVSDLPIPGVHIPDPSRLGDDDSRLGTEAGAMEQRPGALAVFTSGSTGPPKAALLSWAALLASARGVNAHLRFGSGDRWLLDLPVAHVGGLGVVVRCAVGGGAMAVPTPGASVAESVEALQPTHASLVSTQLRRLLDAHATPSSVRAILLGGSAIPEELIHRATEAGLPMCTSYGLTEMASTVAATRLGAGLGTSGRVLASREVAVREGEIHVRGATRFGGYLVPKPSGEEDRGGLTRSSHEAQGNPAAQATVPGHRPPPAPPVQEERAEPNGDDGLVRPFDADGWFATGDLGRLDDEGRLIVEGRKGLQFVSGGENIQPEAIERALLRLSGVAEAVVVPVEDEAFGHRPVAFVRMETGAPPDGQALGAGLRESLPGFMVPVAFHAWEGARGMKPDRVGLAARAT
ncbi:MAG: AMP-binding protein [Bacteroidota bacterium]